MQRVAVLNVVGLTPSLLGEHTPRLSAFAAARGRAALAPVLPAVTTSVQASMTTGLGVEGHGIVGNGWYHRDLAEVRFWHRSNRLVGGEPVWDAARRIAAGRGEDRPTVANLFWWYNSYSTCDFVVQARPIYKADGRKLPDCYTHPAALRARLQQPPPGGLGMFPLFRFWGPAASVESSQWIADAAATIEREHAPTLSFVYLPHLDYPLQKLGPCHADIPDHLRAIDTVVGGLVDAYAERGVRVLILSEYGIESCAAGDASIAINRRLREAGWLAVRDEDGFDVLDPGASAALAVADHQVAHVYLDAERLDQAGVTAEAVRRCCSEAEGVADIVELDHERAGDFTLIADAGRWFRYDYWLDDARAPDFARTVDIHRKPGYDPRELLLDPTLTAGGKLRVARRLAQRKFGMRALLDVIPLDAALVRGTHGRVDMPAELRPVLLGAGDRDVPLPCTAVRDEILAALRLARVADDQSG